MRLDFRELAAAGDTLPLQGEIEIPRIVEENAQIEQMSPIEANLVATQQPNRVQVAGELRASLHVQCSRCLDVYESALVAPFDESFANAPGNDDVHVVDGNEVDLDAFVEESVNLALDYRPLCREDCRGLCPVCGCNLNRETCSCDRQPRDVRWAALEDLLSKDESE